MTLMDYQREEASQCYNFSGIRVFLKKYKPKRQNHDHCKNNVPNQRNKISTTKHSNQFHDHDDNHIHKITNAKNTDAKNQMKGMKKVKQIKNNGVEKEENNNNVNIIGQSEDECKDYQSRNRLLRAIIALLDPSKKKKVSSTVQSASESTTTFYKHSSRGHSLHSNFLSEDLGGSLKSGTGEETREEVCKSKRRWFEERTNHGSFKNNSIGRTQSKKSQVIMFSSSSGPLKPPTIELKLDCTLEELCHGCVKKIKVTRGVYTCTGQRTKREEVLSVNIEPGWISGRKITFQTTKEDISAGEFPADVIFTINEKHHPLFLGVEDDLELQIEIPLSDALTGCPLTIPLLGKDNKMSMELDQVVYPGYEVTISGQGMPKPNSPEERGDLKIKFHVNFPKELTDEQRKEVYRILNEMDSSHIDSTTVTTALSIWRLVP